MTVLATACNLATFAVSITASVYWYRSSRVPAPRELHGSAMIGGRVDVNTNPLLEAAKESGRLNSIAAKLSAGAALLVALSTVL